MRAGILGAAVGVLAALTIGVVIAQQGPGIEGNGEQGGGGTVVDIDYQEGTFTATFVEGCTVDPTFTFNYTVVGDRAVVSPAEDLTCPDGTGSFFRTNTDEIPPVLTPTLSAVRSSKLIGVSDGSSIMASFTIDNTGRITLQETDSTYPFSLMGWNPSGGERGVEAGFSLVYQVVE